MQTYSVSTFHNLLKWIIYLILYLNNCICNSKVGYNILHISALKQYVIIKGQIDHLVSDTYISFNHKMSLLKD